MSMSIRDMSIYENAIYKSIHLHYMRNLKQSRVRECSAGVVGRVCGKRGRPEPGWKNEKKRFISRSRDFFVNFIGTNMTVSEEDCQCQPVLFTSKST